MNMKTWMKNNLGIVIPVGVFLTTLLWVGAICSTPWKRLPKVSPAPSVVPPIVAPSSSSSLEQDCGACLVSECSHELNRCAAEPNCIALADCVQVAANTIDDERTLRKAISGCALQFPVPFNGAHAVDLLNCRVTRCREACGISQ
jgi:hypothetical protein